MQIHRKEMIDLPTFTKDDRNASAIHRIANAADRLASRLIEYSPTKEDPHSVGGWKAVITVELFKVKE